MIKISIIGAGSSVFTKRIVTDLLLMDEFKSIHIALMDIDTERLKISKLIVEAIAKELSVTPKIMTYNKHEEALKGSDFVVTSIQVGGYNPATIIDFNIPKKYGLKQTIADTLGMGGIMRGLRTIPVLVDIGKMILKYCPDALWLQYVNPMCMNMIAINKFIPEIKSVGLCHSVQGTAEMLADDLNEDIHNIEFLCAGINHMSFYLEFSKKNKDGSKENLYPKLKELANKISEGDDELSSRAMEMRPSSFKMKRLTERIRYEILKHFGFFVTESSEHFAEYVPWFIKKNRNDLIEKYQIPIDEYIDRCEYSIKKWNNYSHTLKEESKFETYRSNEYASDIIHSCVTDEPIIVNGNVINNDLINNLPSSACVEVPCLINNSGISPIPVGELPPQLVALIQTNINVQQLTVEAILSRKKEHVYHAAMMDPHTAAELSIDEICNLTDEMLEAHGDIIPKLN